MLVNEFVQKFKNDKISNSKVTPNAVSDYLKKELEIKTYLPFRKRRMIVETVVAQNTEWVDGIKRNDAINQYIGFVVAMIGAHTSLQFSNDPVTDYDLLAESGLLTLIVEEFRTSYDECDTLLKMVLAAELEDNNINVLVGRFLNNITEKIDGFSELVKGRFGNIDIERALGGAFKQEDLAKLSGFLDKYNK